MHKGFCTVLGLLFLSLLTACGGGGGGETPAPVPPPPPSEITVTGQIMLGPVMPDNSLQVEAFDKDNKSLGTSPVSLDGSYGINLKDHNGLVIVRVYSNNPNTQCSGSGDYIDEATAEPACFGTRTLLSTSAVNKRTDSSNGKLEVHSTPLTTMAAFHVGLDVNAQGELSVPSDLSEERVESSNKVIAQALGLGDKPITEIKPTSLITSEKQFKQGDAYANALAIISGAEADNTNQLPNDLLRQISKGITTVNNNPKLDQSTQDLMVKGLQKVSDKIKQKTTDKTILNDIISDLNKAQDDFPDSNHKTNLTKELPKPQFTNGNKTSNLQPVWQWKSHKLGSGNYKYKFADDTEWIETKDTKFTPTTPLKLGSHTLEIRERESDVTGGWGRTIESLIEIVANNEGLVSIDGKPKQGENLSVKVSDSDDIVSDIKYQWYRDNRAITKATNATYTLAQDDVGKRIKVTTSYTDKLDSKETLSAETDPIEDINDQPTGQVKIDSKPSENQIITAEISLFDLDIIDPDSYIFEWQVAGKPSSNQTGNSYQLNQLDVGKKVILHVSYTDKGGYKHKVSSNETEPVLNINNGPKGKPAILSKTTRIEQYATITANIDHITDDDGINPLSYTYKWKADGKIIGVESDYELTQAEVNQQISVTVTYKDLFDNEHSIESEKTSKVININDAPKGKPAILSNTTRIEQNTLLSAETSLITDDDEINPSSYTYEWKADGKTIGEESDYKLTQAEVNQQISVTVTYKDLFDNTHSIESEKTPKVININDQPEFTNSPHVINIHENNDLNYQIKASDKDRDTLKYTLSADKKPDGMTIDEGSGKITWLVADRNPETKNTKITVIIDDSSGKTNATNQMELEILITANHTAKLIDENDGLIKIDDGLIKKEMEQGQLLTVNTDNIIDDDGIDSEFTYKWFRSGEIISNETTENYTLTQLDVGQKISVSVSFTDKLGTLEFITSGTTDKPVKNKNDLPTGKPEISGIIKQGKTLTVNNTDKIKDIDGLKGVNYSYVWKAGGIEIDNATDKSFQLTQDQVTKKITVEISYTDNEGTSETITSDQTVPVENINDRPKFDEDLSTNLTATENSAFTYTVSASDADEDTLTYTFIEDKPEGMTINSSGEINWTPGDGVTSGQKTFKVQIDDGTNESNASATQNFIVTVTAKNDTPSINSSTIREATVGDKYTYQVLATDADPEDILKYSLENSPDGMKIDKDSGEITWTPDDESLNQDILVTVVVDDQNNFDDDAENTDGKSKVKQTFYIKLTKQLYEKDGIKYFYTNRTTTKIPVCFQFNDVEGLLKSNVPNSNALQENIYATVEESWGNYTAIKFVGWQECNQQGSEYTQKTLQVMFSDDDSTNTKESTYDASNHHINFVLNDNKDGVKGDKFTIIHEFGHALGFPDENNRYDVFRGGTVEIKSPENINVCTKIKNGQPKQTPANEAYKKQEREDNSLKIISYKEWQQQPYDPKSVMNDCYKDSYDHPQKGLSNADIRRAQQFYGARTDLNYHLMKGDQFFTGLYKQGEGDSNEYKFFEYGVINNDYRDAKPPTDIFRKNFFIAKDNKEDPILFKIPDNDHMTFLNPIDDLFVSFCRKEKNPDLKAISCNTLPTNNSEDTYDTIFKVNTKNQAIYYFDGPYRKNEVHFLYCKKEFLSSNSNFANVKDACPNIDEYNYQSYTLASLAHISLRFDGEAMAFFKGRGMNGIFGKNYNIEFENGNRVSMNNYFTWDESKKEMSYKNNLFTGFLNFIPISSTTGSGPCNVYTCGNSPGKLGLVNDEGEFLERELFYVDGKRAQKHMTIYNTFSWSIPPELTYEFEREYVFAEVTDNQGETKIYRNALLLTGCYDKKYYDEGRYDSAFDANCN